MKRRSDAPPANEFGELRAYLARQGVSQAQIDAAVGTAADGRSRQEVADALRAWLRTLPKAAEAGAAARGRE
jgi:hypothetical protein